MTLLQKARLLVDCAPFVFFSVVAGAYLTVLRNLYGELKLPILMFLAIVLLVTGHRALQRMRDIASGLAPVREDVLQNVLGRGRQRRRRSHHTAEFATLCRLKLTPNAFRQAIGGRRHRVIYSPASKIAWEVEAAEP